MVQKCELALNLLFILLCKTSTRVSFVTSSEFYSVSYVNLFIYIHLDPVFSYNYIANTYFL